MKGTAKATPPEGVDQKRRACRWCGDVRLCVFQAGPVWGAAHAPASVP